MAADSSDDLTRTATAAVGAAGTPAPLAEIEPIGPTLGRYKLERELGSGGMGVVHAAFDPDLERHVALKVLRSSGQGDDEKRRLLREARAMARLAHPNVVTVHEVGSVGGRDFVAMEMVEGETLAEWLAAGERSEADIVEAFAAAGRGLAAAHGAGIVHRDFKPHNVLRSKGGRVVVTDFGLARSSGETAVAAEVSGSSLGNVTVTGNVLGTPAYMAPEQWTGGALTPATDQFAFCVALWEALAGERPFRAEKIEELADEVRRGPSPGAAARLPRRLRAPLSRGLDPDPAKRWPSMEALLAAMLRKGRGALVAAIAGGVVVAGGVALYVALSGRSAPVELACPEPAQPPDRVWSDGIALEMRAKGRAFEAQMIGADFATWQSRRAGACSEPPRLACLDGVLARIDIVARAVEALPREAPAADPGELLVDPAVCTGDRVAQLVRPTAELRETLAALFRQSSLRAPLEATAATALLARAKADPCAAAWAHVLAADTAADPAERDRHLRETEQLAVRCDDERVRADMAILQAGNALESGLGAGATRRLDAADAAVERVAQPDLRADVDVLRMVLARREDDLDEAIARGQAASLGYAQRGRVAAQVRTGLDGLDVREARASAEDLAVIPQRHREWRALAVERLGAGHPIVRQIDGAIGARLFLTGDVAKAHEVLDALRRPEPSPNERRIVGRVVDDKGAPVAGARVVAAPELVGDSLSIALPFPGQQAAMRVATTSATGEFAIPDGCADGVIVAQLGGRRSLPQAVAGEVTLALGPTSRIAGHVDLRGEPPTRAIVGLRFVASRVPYQMLAPIDRDGNFALDAVPHGRVHVYAGVRSGGAHAFVGDTFDFAAPRTDLRLAIVWSQRVVHVVVRGESGAPTVNAQAVIIPGARTVKSNLEAMQADFASGNVLRTRTNDARVVPDAVKRVYRKHDLFATAKHAPEGEVSACAWALPDDPELDRKLTSRVNLAKIRVSCAPIAPGGDVIVVEVEPAARLD